jgi:hypothetical protein
MPTYFPVAFAPRATIALLSLIVAAASFAQPATAPTPPTTASAPPEIANAEPRSPTVVDTVIVKNPKHAAVMPYDIAYERLKRMQDSKLDRVRLQIKITPKDDSVKLADVRAAIVNDTASVPLPIAKDGSIELPVRPDLYKTDAEIRTNQPKGSLSAGVSLGVGWPGGSEIAYADVEETVRQLQHAGKDLMGWFAYMVFFPSLTNFEVPIQFPVPRGQTMKVTKDGRVVETYTADDKGLLKFRLKREWEMLQPTLVFSEALPKS